MESASDEESRKTEKLTVSALGLGWMTLSTSFLGNSCNRVCVCIKKATVMQDFSVHSSTESLGCFRFELRGLL